MKRFFAMLLLFVMVFGLVACGGNGETPSDTSSQETQGSTDTSSSTSTDNGKTEVKGYDDSIDHLFIATDIRAHSIVVYDLDLCDGDFKKLVDDDVALVWEWDADDDPNCKIKPGAGIDSAKIRYSPYYKKDVMIACSSSGWAGVIDYEKKSLLWEYKIGDGPHSIELLPNSGDIVVACSSGSTTGKLSIVPLSAGVTKPSHHIFVPSGHGVQWDPENEWLWVLEFTQVFACKVEGEGTKNARLVRINGTGDDFGGTDASGHAFSPVYGQPGKYWVTAGKLWQFDTETETLTQSFNRFAAYNANSIKGIASFSDGTVVETVAGFGGKTAYDWSCGGFRIVTIEWSKGKVKQLQPKVTNVYFEDREFYKVQPFNKNYQ